MKAYAEHQFWLDAKEPNDTSTRRDNYSNAIRQIEESVQHQLVRLEPAKAERRQKLLDKLNGPELPLCCQHVWDWFEEIRYMVTGGGFGPSRIPPSEWDAWIRNRERYGVAVPVEWEFRALQILDSVFVTQALKEKPTNGG